MSFSVVNSSIRLFLSISTSLLISNRQITFNRKCARERVYIASALSKQSFFFFAGGWWYFFYINIFFSSFILSLHFIFLWHSDCESGALVSSYFSSLHSFSVAFRSGMSVGWISVWFFFAVFCVRVYGLYIDLFFCLQMSDIASNMIFIWINITLVWLFSSLKVTWMTWMSFRDDLTKLVFGLFFLLLLVSSPFVIILLTLLLLVVVFSLFFFLWLSLVP